MRGVPERQVAMLTTLSTEDLIPAEHPIRRIRAVVDELLVSMNAQFDAMYSRNGRPSVPPEQLLKATVLMALCSMRSERAFCEAAELRPAVQVVPRPCHRRSRLRPHDVYPAWRHARGNLGGHAVAQAQEGHCRRLGCPEDLQKAHLAGGPQQHGPDAAVVDLPPSRVRCPRPGQRLGRRERRRSLSVGARASRWPGLGRGRTSVNRMKFS